MNCSVQWNASSWLSVCHIVTSHQGCWLSLLCTTFHLYWLLSSSITTCVNTLPSRRLICHTHATAWTVRNIPCVSTLNVWVSNDVFHAHPRPFEYQLAAPNSHEPKHDKEHLGHCILDDDCIKTLFQTKVITSAIQKLLWPPLPFARWCQGRHVLHNFPQVT